MADDASQSDDGDFVVQSITTTDGTRTQVKSTPATPNRRNIVQYPDYDSSSSSAGDQGVELPPNPPTTLNTKQALRTPNGENGTAKKRVRFSEDAQVQKWTVDKASRPEAPKPLELNTPAVDEEQLQADMQRLEQRLGLVRDKEDIDADLADAEDRREEATQNELLAKVQQMRERLSGNGLTLKDKSHAALSLAGDEIKLSLRAAAKGAEDLKSISPVEDSPMLEGGTGSEDGGSGDDIDLMRDWAQLND